MLFRVPSSRLFGSSILLLYFITYVRAGIGSSSSKRSTAHGGYTLLAWKTERSICSNLSVCFQFRSATTEDVSQARRIMLQQAMNPLFLSQENLLVAFDETTNEESLIGFGQIRPLDDSFSELASLYVVPDRRRQGIGGAIVQALLERHYATATTEAGDPASRLCLLTLKPTAGFYETFGFHVATESEQKQLPSSLQIETKVGNLISAVLGNDLVCMVN